MCALCRSLPQACGEGGRTKATTEWGDLEVCSSSRGGNRGPDQGEGCRAGENQMGLKSLLSGGGAEGERRIRWAQWL